MPKKILITGGAGFIGVNTARHFLKRGTQVTIFDNFSRKGTDINVATLQAAHPEVKVIRGDLRTDIEMLDDVVSQHDAVLHLAAQVAVTTSLVNPREDFEQNAVATFNVLEAIRQSKNIPSLIYSSTNKVYGALEDKSVVEKETRYEFNDSLYLKHGVPEAQSLDFHSPYGCSKGAADQYVLDYARIYGLRTMVFRQSCIYGEHQFGVEDQGWVAWFTIAAMLGRPITLYGNGKQVRDVLFASDLAQLYEAGFGKIDDLSGRAYNVGGGPQNTLSLIELLAHLKKVYGYMPDLSYAAIRAGDQPIFIADVRKVKKDLGWAPTTGVEEGIALMHGWLVQNKEIVEKVLGIQ